jgi:hypothetical protein
VTILPIPVSDRIVKPTLSASTALLLTLQVLAVLLMEEKSLDKSTVTRHLVSVFALATTTTIAPTPKELTAWTMEFASTAELMLIAMLATLGMEIMTVTEVAKTLFASLVALTTTSATTMKIA